MAGCVPGDGSDCVRARGDGGDGLCGIGGHVADAEAEDLADRQRVSRRHDGGLGGGPEERGRRLRRGHGHRDQPEPDRHAAHAVQRHHGELQRRRHRGLAHRVRAGRAERAGHLRIHLRRAPGGRLHVPRPRAGRDRNVRRRAGWHHRHADQRRPGRLPRAQGPRPLRHRQLRLRGHGQRRGSVHAVPDQLGRRRHGGGVPAPEHGPSGRGRGAGAELRLQRQPAAMAAAGPRSHQLGHQQHPPGLVPQLLRPGHRRRLHRRQRVELAVPVHARGDRPARLQLPGR